ncbi:hypothetical protein [Spirosoma flavum]|uniref:Lipocalin-like domain-containing protein n=1 Tax=Spirosoma flavum TaxID=2048557 RepID=A0ABW6AV51_9BACT
MKPVSYLLILLGTGLLQSCQELTPLSPPNPLLGNWIIESHEIYHLPTWFVAKTHTEYRVTPTDTIYGNGTLAQVFNVYAFTLSTGGKFTETYFKNGGLQELSTIQVDSGKWILADSVITLAVDNVLPHKLTYKATTDRLMTDRFPQKSVLRLADGSVDTINYTIKLWYRRSP